MNWNVTSLKKENQETFLRYGLVGAGGWNGSSLSESDSEDEEDDDEVDDEDDEELALAGEGGGWSFWLTSMDRLIKGLNIAERKTQVESSGLMVFSSSFPS